MRDEVRKLDGDVRHDLQAIETALGVMTALREHIQNSMRNAEGYAREHRGHSGRRDANDALRSVTDQLQRTLDDTKRALAGRLHPDERKRLMAQQDELLSKVRSIKPGV
jgi:hypothetical protein